MIAKVQIFTVEIFVLIFFNNCPLAYSEIGFLYANLSFLSLKKT